jgi:hypothetical protein
MTKKINANAIDILQNIMEERNWHASLGIDRRLACEYKRNLPKGKVSYEKACKLLEGLGFAKIREETWEPSPAY